MNQTKFIGIETNKQLNILKACSTVCIRVDILHPKSLNKPPGAYFHQEVRACSRKGLIKKCGCSKFLYGGIFDESLS